jgi:hypothetical protein
MPAVARPKKPTDRHKTLQIPLRLPDPRLADALDELARRAHRSRNMHIIHLLEEAARSAGLWPPQEPEDPDA